VAGVLQPAKGMKCGAVCATVAVWACARERQALNSAWMNRSCTGEGESVDDRRAVLACVKRVVFYEMLGIWSGSSRVAGKWPLRKELNWRMIATKMRSTVAPVIAIAVLRAAGGSSGREGEVRSRVGLVVIERR